MSRWLILLLLGAAAAFAQQPVTTSSNDADVMVAAVSRDSSVFGGGIDTGIWTGRGTVYVEPMGYLTQTGEWKALPCSKDWPKTCLKFAREYLNKPHTYIVVSADGQGATIQAAPTKLSECRDYSGPGTYSGASIAKSAIAASSADFFANSEPLKPLSYQDSSPIRKELGRLVPQKLDSVRWMRGYSLRLEGQEFFIAQRSYSDTAAHSDARYDFIFAIGTMDQGRFHILHWKKNTEYEEERVLGTIHMKSGREFLITTVSDPESQFFRVYGICDGKVALVYEGGGSSC